MKEIRLKRKITVSDFAASLGISTGYLNNIERGRSWISVDIIENVKKVLVLSDQEHKLLLDSLNAAKTPSPDKVKKEILSMVQTFFIKKASGFFDQEILDNIIERLKSIKPA